ncbi:MAG: SDR family oxidoreductase, partial [Dehalococcoidia bacterium]
NAIAPGVTMTEATVRVTGGRAGTGVDTLVKGTALDRTLDPDDLTVAAAFLASDDSAQMTGQTLVVDAGNIMLG